jgi:hypothetical protein
VRRGNALRKPATPDFAFQGLAYSPILASSTSVPSRFGFDHGQQNPAVIRAE